MKITKNKKFILAGHLVGVVLLVAVLGLFFWGWYYITYSHDTFISPNELKAQSAAIPLAPDKVCERPADPQFVSQNYSVCCPDADKTPNCICRLPGIKSCQKRYNNCLAGRVFSKESIDFLGSENMPTVCQKLIASCGISITDGQSVINNPIPGMKPDMTNSGNSICSVDGYKKDNLAKFCGQICQQIPGCSYYQTDALMGSCGLFKGQPTPLEKGAAASPIGNYQLFMSPAIQESFADITATEPVLGQAAKFCLSGAVDKCSNKPGITGQDCLCSHAVIKDCQKLNIDCLKTSNIKSCQAQFGSCCGIIDSADPKANASMTTEGKIGNGSHDDILCSPAQITSLNECKTSCLKNTKCDFISSNLLDSGSDRPGLTNDGLAPFCHLFKGKPLTTSGAMLGQKTGSSKSIYMKQRGNPDEREINAEFAKK
jgi:hypothetical protein